MAGESYPSLYSNMNFSNAGNFADVAKQVNTGDYLNTPSGTFADNSQFNFNVPNAPISTPGNSNWFSKLFSSKDPMTGEMTPDYMGAGLGLLKSGLGFYLGSQQLGQAEDTLAENKRQFNTNYAAQKTLINDQLNWQYQARKDRNAANAGELAQIA